MKRRGYILTASMEGDTTAIRKYCEEHNLDGERLLQSMGATGGSSPATYIEEPNETLIRSMGEFLAVSSPAIFVMVGVHGLGKTTAKDFVVRVLLDNPRFVSVSIDTPGPYTETQFGRLLYDSIQRQQHEKEKGGASKGLVYHPKTKEARDVAVRAALTRMREGGVTTIIWVDEAQTLTIEKFGMLRRLADITTSDGAPVCKVVVSGTPQLQKKMESWRSVAHHEDAMGAIDDRIGLYTLTLSPWTQADIVSWWQKLVDAAALSDTNPARNPFDLGLAAVIHEYSDGQPRSISQLSVLALTETARRVTGAAVPVSGDSTLVCPADLSAALAPRVHQNQTTPQQSKGQKTK